MKAKILVVDDEVDMLEALERFLRRKGFTVQTAGDGAEALRAMEETQFDLVLSDLAMERMDGMDLLRAIQAQHAALPFIIMTGVGTIESAVAAIQAGAYHYVTKPFKLRDVALVVKRALEHGSLHRRLAQLQDLEERQVQKEMVIGFSRAMRELMGRVAKIADSDAPVLIQGETGTGKSMLARTIHEKSDRTAELFLTIDCGALAETLLESEFFGHVKTTNNNRSQAARLLEISRRALYDKIELYHI